MPLRDIRNDPETVDAGWLTEVLEDAGVARGALVTELGPIRYVGTGQMGRSVRFPLTWTEPDGRPASVIGKFPTTDEAARANAFTNGAYAKEHLFYTGLRPTVQVRAPDMYAALFDAEAQAFAFLMEDLSGSAQGDQFRGLTPDEAALGVEQAVALHAPRWGDEGLVALLPTTRRESAGMLQMIYAATVAPTLERLAQFLDDEAVGVARAVEDVVTAWAVGTDSPSTLVHMDFRPDNFLFAVADDAPPLVVVDWQTITYSLGTHDLAYMIGGSFERNTRADVEQALVRDYRERLAAAGVAYDADTCWRDYRTSSVWGVIMSVIATMLAAQTERGDRMLATMLNRHAHHVVDLEALALFR